ncbi:hypothetical protein [Glycomyces sp. NPDC048151]|uniref:phage major capsid protein n=1 Tax=Glycomyces sp. NPDC048151 TaxID=3364002 RepID=UPI00371AB8AD
MPVSYPGYREPGVLVQANKFAAVALALLQARLILPAMFDRHSEAEFVGAMGDVVNVRRPSWIVGQEPLPMRKNRSGYPTGALNSSGSAVGYIDSKVNEYTIPVKLDKDLYSAFKLTDEMLRLDIASYAAQVLDPQTRAIAEKYESIVAQAMRSLFQVYDYPEGTGATGTVAIGGDDLATATAKIRGVILIMRKVLNDRNVDGAGRHLLVGSAVESLMLQDPNLIRADWAGDNAALRSAQVGRIYGFNVATSSSIGENEIYAWHPSALRLVSMAPATPEGVTYAASLGAHGLSLRLIRDYDYAWAMDRSLMNCYFGIGNIVDYATAAEQTAADETKLRQYRGVRAVIDFDTPAGA